MKKPTRRAKPAPADAPRGPTVLIKDTNFHMASVHGDAATELAKAIGAFGRAAEKLADKFCASETVAIKIGKLD